MAPIFCDRCGDAVAEGCDPLDELAQFDALLERLTLKRYDLKRKINRFHSLIIRQLPPDITSTIFEFCLPDFADFQPSPEPSPSKVDLRVPLCLGSICSYWREIAWSTPCLWSSLVVDLNRDSHTAIVQEWLARSGQLPLSIRIFSPFYDSVPKGSLQAVPALANIINQYSARWSDFDLCVPQIFHQFFHATDNHAPILKSIRFHCSNAYAVEKFQLTTCPRLVRANLSWYRTDGFSIQWDNLTHLNLQHISIIVIFLILRKTPRLVFCEISDIHSKVGDLIVGPILSSLRSLHLITAHSFNKFLDNLITPCLEELSVSRHYKSVPTGAIASFLERSACSLRSFSIIFNVSTYFEGFMSLLPLMPSLKTFSITSAEVYGDPDKEYDVLPLVVEVLSSQSATLQQGLLPNLEVLECTGKPCLHPGNYADLYPLPPADNAEHGPLRLLKFDLYSTIRIPENLISYFLSLAERGVTVNVLSKSQDILQSSIEYYRNREISMCRDEVDNLDSSLMQDSS